MLNKGVLFLTNARKRVQENKTIHKRSTALEPTIFLSVPVQWEILLRIIQGLNEPTIIPWKKSPFREFWSGHFYGQFFIKTVRGPLQNRKNIKVIFLDFHIFTGFFSFEYFYKCDKWYYRIRKNDNLKQNVRTLNTVNSGIFPRILFSRIAFKDISATFKNRD